MSGPENDSRSVEDLVNAALTEPDETAAWNAICALHWRGSEVVLQSARSLCHSDCPHERRVGADILGQLGVPDRIFPQTSQQVLFRLLESESDPNVLQAIFVAFSHNDAPEIVRVAPRYATHPDADVRHAVVLAVTGYEDLAAIRLLIQLTQDEDPTVRDWATFGLGTQIKLDTAEIREALVARLEDADDNARGEAMIGLARRHDPRAIPAIQHDLKTMASEKALEAGSLSRASELLPELMALRELPNLDAAYLEDVIEDCTPP